MVTPDLHRRPRGARYTQKQLDRALAGEFTRTSARTKAERSAAYRVESIRRIERGEARGLSRSQSYGHPGRGERLLTATHVEWSEVTTTQGMQDLVLTNEKEASRVGKYQRDIRELLDGRMEPRAFRRRWSRRVRTAGGYELEADPDRVVALTFLTGPGPVDRYRRHSPGASS